MLLEELNQAISDMNEIQVLSQNKQNYDTRKILDDNFYKYVIYTTTYIHCLEYASNYLGNKISNEDIDDVLKLLDKYQVFINEDKKYKDYLDSCGIEELFRLIQHECRYNYKSLRNRVLNHKSYK